MNIWLVKFEEDLPIDEGFYPYRMSMLADALQKAGHNVVRWASDYNHKAGVNRFGRRQSVVMAPQYKIELLKNFFRYKNSHSIIRILALYWQSFALLIAFLRAKQKPDAIVVSMPAPITCAVVAFFARLYRIPFFIDVRDMWPDILLDEVRGVKKIIIYPLYALMILELRFAVRRARGLLGITEPFLDFLVKFRKNKRTKFDASFPIGFYEIKYDFSKKKEHDFWLKKGVDFQPHRKIIYFAGTLSKTVLAEMPRVAQAMQILAEKNANLQLVICGRGVFEQKIKAIFSELDNVIFPGHISAPHLAYLKSKSSIALLAIEARQDYLNSLSNKFFDYASGGLPIVTNLTGEPKRVLDMNGAGFIYQNASELADILWKLETDSQLLAQKSAKSRKMFETLFEAGKVYKAMTEHLEKSV